MSQSILAQPSKRPAEAETTRKHATKNIQAKLEARGDGNKGSRERDRLEHGELRSRLFALFAKKDVYMLKELNRELQQSEVGVSWHGMAWHPSIFFSEALFVGLYVMMGINCYYVEEFSSFWLFVDLHPNSGWESSNAVLCLQAGRGYL